MLAYTLCWISSAHFIGIRISRRLQVIGTTLRSLPLDRKAALTAAFIRYAWPRFTDGRLMPVIDSVWNWEQADEAHAYMESNRSIGKIVLRVT
ncbi:zinc-binding dehydrogenase [Paenibacillus chungangensis]|uniref:Zinc-binding dehydrogenase n=1 Tax=Paenibacillus chungangensis TaxID=696535 RepID=A0ABW3HNH4_9BACL